MAVVNPTTNDYKKIQERALDYQQYRSTSDILRGVAEYFKASYYAVYGGEVESGPLNVVATGFEVSAGVHGDKIRFLIKKGAGIFDNQPILMLEDVIYEYDLPENDTNYYVYIQYKYVEEYPPNYAVYKIYTSKAKESKDLHLIAKAHYDAKHKTVTVDRTPLDFMRKNINFIEGFNELLTKIVGLQSEISELNKATEAENLLKTLSTVDGKESGLDADRLDGIEGDRFVRNDINNDIYAVLKYHRSPLIPDGKRPQEPLSKKQIDEIVKKIWDEINKAEKLFNQFVNETITKEVALESQIQVLNDATKPENLLESIKTVDGNGSGLDADFIDGLQSSQLARTDVDTYVKGKYTFFKSPVIPDGKEDNNPLTRYQIYKIADKQLSEIAALNLQIQTLNKATEAENLLKSIKTVDGHGSGLDADFVDGLNAEQLVRSDIDQELRNHFTYAQGGWVATYSYPSTVKHAVGTKWYLKGEDPRAFNYGFDLWSDDATKLGFDKKEFANQKLKWIGVRKTHEETDKNGKKKIVIDGRSDVVLTDKQINLWGEKTFVLSTYNLKNTSIMATITGKTVDKSSMKYSVIDFAADYLTVDGKHPVWSNKSVILQSGLKIDEDHTQSEAGYMKLPNKLIFMWGRFSDDTDDNGKAKIILPTSLNTSSYMVFVTGADGNTYLYYVYDDDRYPSYFKITVKDTSGNLIKNKSINAFYQVLAPNV